MACALCLAGCEKARPATSPLAERAQAYSQLPGLRGSTHPQLQQAFRELEAVRQLPAFRPAAGGPSRYHSLEATYPALIRAGLLREVDALWPPGGEQLSPGGLEQARRIVATQSAARQRFCRALDSIPPQAQRTSADRLLMNDAWPDVARVGSRIEGLAALEAMAEQSPGEAVPMLERMLRMSQQLAREPDLQARLTAARIRSDALQVLSSLVNHPAVTLNMIVRVQQTLSSHTSDWPADEQAWLAEREHGLLVYELVRAGHYLEQLPHDDRVDLAKQGLLSATQAAALKHIDDDQLFYLRAMEQQLAAAKLPYYQRGQAIESLQTELQLRRESGDFPLVAGTLLLADVADIHRQLAEDLCRCEAWLIALAAVQDQSLGASPMCSLTGQAYELQIGRDEVAIVNLPLPGQATIRIRRPGVVQAQRRAAGFELR